MPQYKYIAADLRTNVVLEELPLKSVTFTDELSEPGTFTASLDMFDLTAQRVREFKNATQPARTAIYVDLDGALQWGGIVWKRRKSSGGVLNIEGAGFLSFYARQRIAETAEFLDVDQFEIVRSLMRTVHSKPGGNIGGVTMGTELSGVLREVTYQGMDRKQVFEAVDQLSQAINGFDLAILAEYAFNGIPGKRLLMGYPKLGRSSADSDLVLDFPGNVDSYTWPEEGDRMLTRVYVRGDGEGEFTPTSIRTNASLMSGGYPRLEDEFSAPGVIEEDMLDALADAYLTAYAGPVVLPEFKIASGTVDPPLSAYGPGDSFTVEITDPEWFPQQANGTAGYQGTMRLVKRSVTPDPGGAGQDVTLTMSPFLGDA